MKKLSQTYLILLMMFCQLILTSEGNSQEVLDSYEFHGNDHFSDSQLLEWAGVAKGGPVKSEFLRQLNEKIIGAYQKKGYLFARIDSATISTPEDEKLIELRWYLNEGPLVLLGSVKFVSDSADIEQLDDLVDFNEGDIYRPEYIEAELKGIGQYFADRGYPLAVLNIMQTSLRKEKDEQLIDLLIKIETGVKIKIDKILLKGNRLTNDKVILRELGIRSGEYFNQEKINDIPVRLNRLGFFNTIPMVKIIGLEDNHTDLLIEMEEGNTTTFDGVIGYIPAKQGPKSEDGYFTGLLNISFKNLFGTGRKFNVYWRKQDRFSEEFRLFYEEPWVFDYPFNLGGGLERIVRDTTFIEWTYSLNTSIHLSTYFKGILRYKFKEVIPDSLASRQLRMTKYTLSDGEIGIEYDTRDYPVNPRTGLRYVATFAFGLKENKGPSYLFYEDSLARREGIKKLQIGLFYYQRLWKNQVLSFRLYGAHLESDKDQLQLSDHIWFGGFETLRGYREDQFHGTTVSWVNLEYRFLIGRNSRVFLFNDWGFYQYEEKGKLINDILPGFGLGLRFDSPLGVMGIDYGFGRGDTFSTGKIHFGIINSF